MSKRGPRGRWLKTRRAPDAARASALTAAPLCPSPSAPARYCNDCRDLDLCRDPELQGQRWACATCAQPYDMAAIEARLVKLLGARIREYVLQDLQCHKCKQVGHVEAGGGGGGGAAGQARQSGCGGSQAARAPAGQARMTGEAPHGPIQAACGAWWLQPCRPTACRHLPMRACTQIAAEHLCGSCKQCGGSLTNTVRPDVARKRLVVFRNLATYHKFELLQQLADGALALA